MELQLIFVSFIAGVLTILAPCIFPLLPILIGSSTDGKASKKKAFTVIGSLLASITILTLLIHGTSNFFNINEGILRAVSTTIIVSIGFVTLFPHIWEKLAAYAGWSASSNKLLGKAMKKDGKAGDVLIGASLGPVFSSCSPTYGLIIATILPVSFIEGSFYLFWYILGLGLMFLMIALLGQKLVKKLEWATNPEGIFKRVIGFIFIVIGIAIFFNFDKDFEAWLLNFDFYNNLVDFELGLN